MLSKRSSLIFIVRINILDFWICMLMQPGKEYLSMVTQRTNLKSKSIYAFFLKFYLLIVKFSNMKVAISLRKICTAKTSTIMSQNKVQEELLFSKPPKILSVGLSSVTTTQAESSTTLSNLDKKNKPLQSLTKRLWTLS